MIGTKFQLKHLFISFLLSKVTDADAEKLTMPGYKHQRYENPWSTWSMASFAKFLKWRFVEKNNTNLPSDNEVKIQKTSKNVTSNLIKLLTLSDFG
jgi:hypothetical protein